MQKKIANIEVDGSRFIVNFFACKNVIIFLSTSCEFPFKNKSFRNLSSVKQFRPRQNPMFLGSGLGPKCLKARNKQQSYH